MKLYKTLGNSLFYSTVLQANLLVSYYAKMENIYAMIIIVRAYPKLNNSRMDRKESHDYRTMIIQIPWVEHVAKFIEAVRRNPMQLLISFQNNGEGT